jgi:hypothetical protein
MNNSTERRALYPWQHELNEWNAVRQNEIRKQMLEMKAVSETRKPHAAVSNLLNLAKLAREHPEIWEMFAELPEKIANDPDYEMSSDEIHLCGQFSRWYRMKKELDDTIIAYAYLPGLLRQYALGLIDWANEEKARKWLLQFPFVQDDAIF